MPSIRTTRDKFSELIDTLNDVKSGLNAEIDATDREAEKFKDALKEGIALALPALTPEIIDRLDRAGDKAKTGRNFTTMTLGLFEQDAETKKQITALQDQWKSPATMIEIRDQKKSEYAATESRLTAAQAEIENILTARHGIDLHNKTHPTKITTETKNRFTPLNRWKYLTSEDYRSGYKAVRDYRPLHGDFAGDCLKMAELNADNKNLKSVFNACENGIALLNTRIDAMDKLKTDITLLEGQIKGPEGILNTLRSTALQLALDNPDFAAALATEAGWADGAHIAVPALKIRTLDRALQGLKAHKKGVVQTLEKLETPMSKLNKGVRNAPSKSITIDLAGIEKGVKGQVAAAKGVTGNANTFRSSVSAYTPVYHDDSSFYFLHNYLLMDMLLHHNDHAYCYNTIGIPQPCTDTLNNLTVPDICVQTPDIAQNFNTAAPDVSIPDIATSNVCTPDFTMPDVSVPTFSVPDVSVSIPDVSFSIPDVSVPSFDTSSFSSFDSSSSFSSFDSSSFS